MTRETHARGLERRPAETTTGTLAIIRQRTEETVEQAFFRHYAERPEDTTAGQTVFLYAFSTQT